MNKPNPHEKIEIFYLDKYRNKISFTIFQKDFEHHKILFLEKSQIENLGDIWYTKNNLTTKLDYYND